MNIKAKVIQGVAWSAIQNWGSQIGSLLVFLILARLLEPKAFGLVALANVFLAFIQVFLEQGFAQALIQREELELEHLDTAFWTSFISGILLTLIGITVANPVANKFQQPQLAPILQWLAILFIINSFNKVQQAILQRQFAYKAIATRSLIGTFAGGVTGVFMAYKGYGVWSLVGQQLVQELVGTLVIWQASDWRPRFRFSIRHFKELFHFGINILAFNFLGFLNNRADDFLIGIFLGSTALGFYSIGYRIMTLMSQVLVNTTTQVALPAFSRLQENPDLFRRAFFTATQITSAIAFPIFSVAIALAPEIVVTCFGQQWLPSVSVVQVLCMVGILRSVTYFKGSIFMALGKPNWRLYFGLLSAGLNVFGFAISVRWGITAVAIAYLIRALIVFPITQSAVSRLIQTPLHIYLKLFISPFVSSLMMFAVILLAKQLLENSMSTLPLLIVNILLGISIYILAIRFIAPNLFYRVRELVLMLSFKTSD